MEEFHQDGLKVLWNTTKIDFHCIVKCFFNTFPSKIAEKIISYEVKAFSKLKKILGQPNSPRPQKEISETILTIWHHKKKNPIVASSITLRAERIAPLVFYMMNCMQFFFLFAIWSIAFF